MKEFLPLIQDYIAANKRCVLVTIVEIIGSSPRDLGTSMLVSEKTVEGFIGGGNLEYRAIAKAHELLSDNSSTSWHEEFFGLGPALNQCCGGAVKLLFEVSSQEQAGWIDSAMIAINETGECHLVTDLNHHVRHVYNTKNLSDQPVFTAAPNIFTKEGYTPTRVVSANDCYLVQRLSDTRTTLVLFGAGHVGKAVVQALSPLPFRIQWVDQRTEMFPESIPHNVQRHKINDPSSYVEQTATDSFCLVMTHSHQLDYEICKAVLKKSDNIWLGLIGSVTKRRRFEQRLLKDGIAQHRLDRLVCPIGVLGITDKHPSAIAASVAAQLLQERELHQAKSNNESMTASA